MQLVIRKGNWRKILSNYWTDFWRKFSLVSTNVWMIGSQLVHILQLVVKHYKVYYPVRHHLVQHIVSSIQRLGFNATATIEQKKLAVDLCEIAIKWEVQVIFLFFNFWIFSVLNRHLKNYWLHLTYYISYIGAELCVFKCISTVNSQVILRTV